MLAARGRRFRPGCSHLVAAGHFGAPRRPTRVVAGGAGMDVDPVLTLLIRGLVLLVVLGLLALIVRNTRRR